MEQDKQSSKLAVDDGYDEQHQDSDDGNGDDAVCSHPASTWLVHGSWITQKGIQLQLGINSSGV